MDTNKILSDFSSSLEDIRAMIQILGQDCKEHYELIQLLEPLQFLNVHTAVRLAPAVKGCFSDAVFAAERTDSLLSLVGLLKHFEYLLRTVRWHFHRYSIARSYHTNLAVLGAHYITLEGVEITQQHKKPPGRELTEKQKVENKQIGHRRVRVEHIICSVKRLRIVKDTIRLTKDTARNMVMEIAVGLHNFRLRINPWPQYI